MTEQELAKEVKRLKKMGYGYPLWQEINNKPDEQINQLAEHLNLDFEEHDNLTDIIYDGLSENHASCDNCKSLNVKLIQQGKVGYCSGTNQEQESDDSYQCEDCNNIFTD